MSERNYRRQIGKRRPENQRKNAYDKEKTQEEVKKIQEKLENFAKTQWGKFWTRSLLDGGRPFRMQRGIQYAEDDERIGNLTINKGRIFATVQGTAPTPYRVKINFEVIPEEGWKTIISELRNKTVNLIELLEGKLPEDMRLIFKENDFPLFPGAITGESASCSCPDKAVPCKHIASVILYLARILDYDPFILMKLRGKDKIDILNDLNFTYDNEDPEAMEKAEIEGEKAVNLKEFSYNVPKISIKELISKQESQDDSDLSNISFHFKKPGKYIETLENLGLPSSLESPLAFEAVLKAIYRTITGRLYSKATILGPVKKKRKV